MHHNVAERDACVFSGTKNRRVSSNRTSSVFVGDDAQALSEAKRPSGFLDEALKLFEEKTCKRLRPEPVSPRLERVGVSTASLPKHFLEKGDDPLPRVESVPRFRLGRAGNAAGQRPVILARVLNQLRG